MEIISICIIIRNLIFFLSFLNLSSEFRRGRRRSTLFLLNSHRFLLLRRRELMTWHLWISHNIAHHALIVTRKWCFWLSLYCWSLLWRRLNWWRSSEWLRWRRLWRMILLLGFIIRTPTTSCLMLRLFILIPVPILLLALIILVNHVLWRNTVVRWNILLLHLFIHFFVLTCFPCLMK